MFNSGCGDLIPQLQRAGDQSTFSGRVIEALRELHCGVPLSILQTGWPMLLLLERARMFVLLCVIAMLQPAGLTLAADELPGSAENSAGRTAPSTEPGLQSGDISYDRDIRPILSNNCFQCHGPDSEAREAELRLDVRSAAISDRDGTAAIVPGVLDASLLIERITTEDSAQRMPPAETKKILSDSQKQLLRNWIAAGAPYEQHWAFRPVTAHDPPQVIATEHVRNEIDAFVISRLEAAGLTPSPEAAAATLIRRVYMDLVGLLPPPEVVEQFVTDPSDVAWRRLVEELLASQHYGERWGRHWLDQARYADSNGYTIDGDRTMWPYRDWVIRAINDDMPFDQFTIEQLAGDLLPNATKSQLVATGFHRNTLINEEGGTDDEQFRNEEVVDRVNTTGAVWLGLTVGCAQCHTHKFDPITHEEYFRLFAFFNQTEDVNNVGPTVEVRENEMLLFPFPEKQEAALRTAQDAVDRLEETQQERLQAWEHRQRAELSLSRAHVTTDWTTLRPAEFNARSAKLRLLDDQSLLAARGAEKESYDVVFHPAEISKIAAFRLRVIPDDSLPNRGPGLADNGNFVLSGFTIRVGGQPVSIIRAQASHSQPGYPIQHAIDGNSSSGWAVNMTDKSSTVLNSEHEAHFILDSAIPVMPGAQISVTMEHLANERFYNVGRFAIDVASESPPPLVSPEFLAAVQFVSTERSAEQQQLVSDMFVQYDIDLQQARAELAAVRAAIGLGPAVRSMVMRDLAEPRTTFRHLRGDFLRPDQESGPLTPDVPAALPPLNPVPGRTANRLDLARWLVRTDNPLTPRVFVNRNWLQFFGRGLVGTENDYGTQGSFPTHPDLLDWLAARFVDNGWSRKSLHRLIVNSYTYRQSSNLRPDLAAVDPSNALLGRQNRLRFDAESVRDAALSASGLLHRQIGGPSVRPPQPDGVYAFTQQNKNWRADTGASRYRRTLYTRFYRSAPHPMLTTFDSPDFQSVCTARTRSNTPLQSLTLANDEGLLELARGTGLRLLHEVAGTDRVQDRIGHLFLICCARLPSQAELIAVADFFHNQRRYFENSEDAAKKVTGELLPEGILLSEAAAWTAVARAIMNTDEFITRE